MNSKMGIISKEACRLNQPLKVKPHLDLEICWTSRGQIIQTDSSHGPYPSALKEAHQETWPNRV